MKFLLGGEKMSKNILKPCPFCGGEAYLEKSHRAFINSKTTRVAFVRCKKCEARTGRVELSKFNCASHSTNANEEVIRMWNTRI